MNLYITQNSYYFVHRHFIDFFSEDGSEIIYVQEKSRGILKKYIEIIIFLGFFNTIKSFFLEIVYLVYLSKIVLKLNSCKVADKDLNDVLNEKLRSNSYNKIISIGCPTKINASLQDVYDVKIYNLHGGILPHQKGRFSPIKSIKKGNKFLGASIHIISNDFDKGNIVSQNFFQIDKKGIMENYNRVLLTSSDLLNSFHLGEFKEIPEEIISSLKN